MLITRESDYAIRILRCLADGQSHKIAKIAETECIPERFARKIAEKLTAGGLIKSVRGRSGGISLNADLHQVMLSDVLNIIENDLCVNLCLTPGYECPWEAKHSEKCRVHKKLRSMQEQLNRMLGSMDMYTVIFADEKAEDETSNSFHINEVDYDEK